MRNALLISADSVILNDWNNLIIVFIWYYYLMWAAFPTWQTEAYHWKKHFGLCLMEKVWPFCSMWLVPLLYLVRVLVIWNVSLNFSRISLDIQRGHHFLRVCLCIPVGALERVRDRMRDRESWFPCAKTFLDTAGSFCPVPFIKVVVLRLSAHTHGLSRLSCGSSMVELFLFLEQGGYVFWTCVVSCITSPVIHIGLLASM